MKIYRILAIFLTIVVLLSSCNLPSSAQPTEPANPNAIFTAAAQTVVAQLTQNALLNPTNAPATVAPPENTSLPATNTPEPPAPLPTLIPAPTTAPTSVCDSAQFVTDVTIPDGTPIDSKATFTKTWRLKNIGTCTWNSSYNLVFDSGTSMSGPASQPLTGTIAPGASVDISVNLQAPATDGTYRGLWGLANGSGTRMLISGGKTFYVEIKVGSGVGSGGIFAVQSVDFSVSRSGSCASGKYVITANITTSGAGDVTYYWIRSDGATDTNTYPKLTFTKASTKSITTEWNANASGLWLDLYIDKPNHQEFKRANLNCP